MKKHFAKYLLRICIVVLGLSFTSESQAQTVDPVISTLDQSLISEALLNDDLSIQLDVNRPLKDTYTIDVDHFAGNMPNQQTAEDFINQFDRENADATLDYDELIVTVKLTFTADNENWTVKQWNEYLK